MDIIDTAVRAGKLLYRPRESLHRFGAFLCREEIAALEHDIASIQARLVERDRELDELHRKEIEQSQELTALRADADRRRHYRHILVDGKHGAFALRRDFGEVPRLVCPKCFERGAISDLCFATRTVNRYTDFAYKLTEVRCSDLSCGFRFFSNPDIVSQAFNLVD